MTFDPRNLKDQLAKARPDRALNVTGGPTMPATEGPPTSPASTMFMHVVSEVECAWELVQTLRARLAPALPSSIAETPVESCVGPGQSELVDGLAGLTNRLMTINQHLRDTLAALEL